MNISFHISKINTQECNWWVMRCLFNFRRSSNFCTVVLSNMYFELLLSYIFFIVMSFM